MSVNSKMTVIANGLRKLLGLSGTMGLDDMANNINTAQTEVDTQNDLIAQISSVLNGKAGGIVPTGTKTIIENGTHDVADFANAQVEVPTGIFPEGEKTITENGTHDVSLFESAKIDVPIPSGYIKPSGTKNIIENGTHDVAEYAIAEVNVPVGVLPSGTKSITTNGTHDVANYANVIVNIDPSSMIKVATGTFTGAGSHIINTGFKPDVVQIKTGEYLYPNTQNGFIVAGLYFENDNLLLVTEMPVINTSYNNCRIRVQGNRYSAGNNAGFQVYINKYSGDFDFDSITFNYVAIKFT